MGFVPSFGLVFFYLLTSLSPLLFLREAVSRYTYLSVLLYCGFFM
jgi:hypothetical protein